MFLSGIMFTVGVNIYEIIDAPRAARRYNAKARARKGALYFHPAVVNGEYRFHLSYTF